ncbi:hypothetical protein ACIRRA_44805 [Nocardia sp. NPDC101769]|uniref:hypothetical protein n=1 Tax=Nocardia sp. NPDC101769 TaxID=3364333 RepID=UPI0037FB3A33
MIVVNDHTGIDTERGLQMGNLSEQFNDLSKRAKKTEGVIDAAAARNRQKGQVPGSGVAGVVTA